MKNRWTRKIMSSYPNSEDPPHAELSELLGKTIVKLELLDEGSELRFFCSDGTAYVLVHLQECCEDVRLEDINGELSWLLDTPVLMADESIEESGEDSEYEHYTWSFYRFATRKGYVDLRFLGSSNGYYSETMDFLRIPQSLLQEEGDGGEEFYGN